MAQSPRVTGEAENGRTRVEAVGLVGYSTQGEDSGDSIQIACDVAMSLDHSNTGIAIEIGGRMLPAKARVSFQDGRPTITIPPGPSGGVSTGACCAAAHYIKPIDSPLEKLTSLNGFSFKMKGDPKQTVEYGVVAQDVQKVFPELVRQMDDSGTLGVSYIGLFAPVIESIKALSEENDELRARNEQLTRRLEALEHWQQEQQIREQ